MKKSLFLFLLLAGQICVGQISITMVFNDGVAPGSGIALSDGSSIADGSTFAYGTLNETNFNALSQAQQLDYSYLVNPSNNVFDLWGTTTFSSGAVFVIGQADPDIPVSTKTYALIDDTSNNEIGLFASTATTWDSSSDANGSFTINGSVIDTVFLGDLSSGNRLESSVIPEPSTYALILGIIALSGIYLRRRRAA